MSLNARTIEELGHQAAEELIDDLAEMANRGNVQLADAIECDDAIDRLLDPYLVGKTPDAQAFLLNAAMEAISAVSPTVPDDAQGMLGGKGVRGDVATRVLDRVQRRLADIAPSMEDGESRELIEEGIAMNAERVRQLLSVKQDVRQAEERAVPSTFGSGKR